jgi:hypothetical protein
VLAEHVYQDKTTGKMIIAGTFNRLFVHRREETFENPPKPSPEAGGPSADGVHQQPGGPPAEGFRKLDMRSVSRVGSPWAYVSLTEIRGSVPLELRYVDLTDNNIMLRAEFVASANSPLETKEMIVPLPVLPAPHPGTYALELLSKDEPLGALRVYVSETPKPEPKPGEEKS